METLKILRKQALLNQRELAEKLGIPKPTYAHYESGRCEPDIATLKTIADYFGCSVDYLIGHTTNSDLTPAQQNLLSLIKRLNDSQVNFLIGWCSNALGLSYDAVKPVAPWN